jgi:hypothetical protein
MGGKTKMRTSAKRILPCLLLLAVPACCSAAGHTSTHHAGRTTHASLHHITGHSRATHSAFHHDTAGMPAERASQIQMALIQKGYLSGEPTGAWDAPSIAAMQKLQADNGWQTKLTPDSRALIKLGLGPQTQTADSTPLTPRP